MNQRNIEIKNYICDYFVQEDSDFSLIKDSALQAGLPKIAVPENVGKLLYMFTKLQKPRRILEVGTLAGYSTTWFAKAAPEAKIITLEYDPKHAAMARSNFENTGSSNRIEVVEGDGVKTLASFIERKEEPFDLIFLDADKKGYPTYLPLLLQLAKPGTLLLTDNLIPKEAQINNPLKTEREAVKTYQYNAMLGSHPDIETILVTTIVGENGRVDALGVSLIQPK